MVMKRKDLQDGAKDGLRPLQGLDLGAVDSFVGLVRGMGDTAFGGRSLGVALDVWLKMAKDEECKVVMTLSGAMTVAQQGPIIVEMIGLWVVRGRILAVGGGVRWN
jgi:deoxyhypusine synthase